MAGALPPRTTRPPRGVVAVALAVGLHAGALLTAGRAVTGAAGAAAALAPPVVPAELTVELAPAPSADAAREPAGAGAQSGQGETATPARPARRRAVAPSAPVRMESSAAGEGGGAIAVGAPEAGDPAAREPSAAPPGRGLARAEAAQGARLLAAIDPCAGLYPAGATAAAGVAEVELEVDALGAVAAGRVLREAPANEGFASAGAACVSRLRFVPARDAAGRGTAALARVRLRFVRRDG